MRKLKLKELNRPSIEEFKMGKKIPLVIVIDNIRSALNIGSIFRTADAMACEKIIICGISATPPNRDIHKSAIGATQSVSWEYEKDVVKAVSQLKKEGYQIFAIEQTDQSIHLELVNLDRKAAIILGNEVHGISNSILDHVDQAIEIEQHGTKHSLNVAVCAGIVIWQLSRILRNQLN